MPALKTTSHDTQRPPSRTAAKVAAIVSVVMLALAGAAYGVALARANASCRAFLDESHARAMQTVRLILQNACEARLRGIVGSSCGIAVQFHEKARGKAISDEAAKQEAADLIQSLRIGRVQAMPSRTFQKEYPEYPRMIWQQTPESGRDEGVGAADVGSAFVPEYKRTLDSGRSVPWSMYCMDFKPWDWVIAAGVPRAEMGDLVDWDEIGKQSPFAPGSDTSFIYILDEEGCVVVHPTWKQGASALKQVDAKGKAFVEEIRRDKKGTLSCVLQTAAGTLSNRVAVYDYLSEQNLIVVSEFDLERVNRPLKVAAACVLWTSAGLLLVFVPLAFLLAGAHVRRVRTAREDAREETVKELRDEASALRAHSSRQEKELANERKIQQNLQKTNEQLSAWVDELKQSSHEIALLNQMGDLLQACQTVEETYRVIGQLARDLFPDDAGALCRFLEEQKMLDTVAVWGTGLAMVPEFALEECWALRRGKAYVVEDTQAELLCQHFTTPPPPHGYICLPMMAQGELLGMFHLEIGQPHPGAPEDARVARIEAKKRLATTVTEQFGLALANLKLRELLRTQSIRDQLTGLFNRRYMEESFVREIHRAQRQGSTLGIIMGDLDHFKKINDTYGHEEGDVILRNVGAILQKSIRQDDIACRYGGEEFTVIMPSASRAIVLQRAEQIRERIKRHVSVKQEPVTISLGMALFPEDGQSAETLLNAADAALYQAKERGRDQVAVYQAPDA